MNRVYTPRVDVFTEDGLRSSSLSWEGQTTKVRWWAESQVQTAEMTIRHNLQVRPPPFKIGRIETSIGLPTIPTHRGRP